MKRIIPSIFLAAALMINVSAHADDVHVEGNLTAEQKATLALEAAKLVTANKTPDANPTTTVDTVKKWTDVGTAIGSGLASSAKELGVAANDFAQTGVGKFTMIIIAWHFIGAALVHVLFGSLWLLGAISLWFYLFRRATTKITTTVYEEGKGPNGAKKITVRAPCPFSADDDYRNAAGTIYTLSLLVIVVIGVVAIMTF